MSDNPDTPVYGSGDAPRRTSPGSGGQEGLTRVTRLHHLAELKAAGNAVSRCSRAIVDLPRFRHSLVLPYRIIA